jgi:trehalose 6-phosphate phosphatase
VGLPDPLLPLAAHPDEAAVLVDFDGSVSAIVDDPAAARILPAARDALAALVDVIGTVGVVSGRPVEFLARAIDLPGLTLVGQYGLERMVDGRAVVDARAESSLDAIAAAADEVERQLPVLLVERKAGVAVTVHWRTAPEREADAIEVVDAIARHHGLVVYPTKMARELRPPVPADKGTAVEAILEGSRRACFAGDDRGDLDAFAALARLASAGRLEDAVRIAVGSAEAPPELLAQADLVVDGPTGLVSVLDELAGAATRTPR